MIFENLLLKVKSDKKAIEISGILKAVQPTHPQRLWLVGFLKFCGYSMPEVIDIIHEHNHWSDYNMKTTAYQVGTIFKQRPQRTQSHITRRIRKWDLSKLEIFRIKYQRSVSLSKMLRKENKEGITFPHPERLVYNDFNPSAEFLRK